jgi:hypothetical protein
MHIFSSEQDLRSVLDAHDGLIRDCLSGRIPFAEFLNRYGNFYASYALDGHESDSDERCLLLANESRIALHREIWESIIAGGLISDELAEERQYADAGRFGSEEGLKRLSELGKEYKVLSS